MSTSIATEIKFVGKDEASAAIGKINDAMKGLSQSGLSVSKVFAGTFLGQSAQQAMTGMAREALALSKSFLDSAREAEGFREQLGLIKGTDATAVLRDMRSQISDMPVSLGAVTQAYAELRAAGINPAMQDMKALADVSGNLAGDASQNVATLAASFSKLLTQSALGGDGLKRQIVALTQQGIPAMDILRDKLNLSAEAMTDLAGAGVTGRDVVSAMFEWMREQQGKTADGFDDLAQKFKNSWQEMQLQVMEAGPFDAMKSGMEEFLTYMNSAKGQMDIRNLLLDIADTTAIAAQAMVTSLMPVARTFQIIGTYAAATKFMLAGDEFEQTQLRAKTLRDQYTQAQAGVRPFKDYDQQDLARRMNEAEASLKGMEQRRDMAAAAFAERDTSFFGSETAMEAVLKKVNDSISIGRQKLADSRMNAVAPRGVQTENKTVGPGLPDTTSYSTDIMAELNTLAGEVLAADKKAWDKAVEQWADAQAKMFKTKEELTDHVNRLTMSEADYQRWALDQEVARLADYAAASEANASDVAEYKKAKLAEIDKAQADQHAAEIRRQQESAQRLKDIVDELQAQMAKPMTRFQQERADLQNEYLRRGKDIDENSKLAPAEAQEARAMLEVWRNGKMADVSQRAGDDFAAGWADGMRKTLDEMKTGFEQCVQLSRDTAQAMSQGFGDFFFDAMQGKLKTFGDYVNSFLTSMQRSIANMMGEMVTKQIITSAVGGFGGMFGGAAAGYTGDVNVANGIGATAANGAVWRGGFTPFGAGGVVTGPTLGLVGEGRYNEAIVPLPDGRSIPVVQKGGGQAVNIRVEVKNQSGQQIQARSEQPQFNGGEWVVGIVLDAVSRNKMGLRDAVRGA